MRASAGLWLGVTAACLPLLGLSGGALSNDPKTRPASQPANSEEALRRALKDMGTGQILVLPVPVRPGGPSTLTVADADAIARQCPGVVRTAPILRLSWTGVVFGTRNWVPNSLLGTTPSYLTARDRPDMADGEMFTEQDVQTAGKVCVVGQTIKDKLFGGESPVGKTLRIGDVAFCVIGVLSAKGTSIMGMDQDDIVLAPWTAIRIRDNPPSPPQRSDLDSRYPVHDAVPHQSTAPASGPAPGTVDQIVVKAVSDEQIPAATEQITALLRKRHGIAAGQLDDFNIRDMTEMKKVLLKTLQRK